MARVFLNNWLKGANTAVSPFLMDDTSLEILNGARVDWKLGAVVKDLGYKRVGGIEQGAQSITGLHDFRQSSSTQKILLTNNDATADDTELWYNNAGTWTEITAAETAWANKASINVEMEDFIGYCFIVGYGATDGFLPVGSLTGTTFSTTAQIGGNSANFTAATTDIITSNAHGLLDTYEITVSSAGTLPAGLSANTKYYVRDVTTNTFKVSTQRGGAVVDITDTGSGTHTWLKTAMPQGKYIKRYRDRLHNANCYIGSTAYPYRVYFSSVPSSEVIHWSQGLDFFDVDYSEEITGIGENWDTMMIFTEYSAYAYNQTSKKKVWDVGCSNHRTIKNSGAYMIWANRDGVWASSGGYPTNISGQVTDFIRNGTPANFFAEVIDEEYHLYVGTVTVNSTTYTNTELVFNIPTGTWRWREFADTIAIFARYNSSGDDRLYMGDSAGNVWEKTKYTDNTPIYSDSYVSSDVNNITAQFTTKPFDFGDPLIIKRIKRIMTFADRAQGLKVKFRILDKNTKVLTPFQSLGVLNQYINVFEGKPKEGNLIQFEFTETSMNPYFSFYGMAIDYDAVGIPPTKR